MGAELWAEGIGARVKPGAWGTVTDRGNEEGLQSLPASLFIHSPKLIPLESPSLHLRPPPPQSSVNLLSLPRESPEPGPAKEKRVTSGHHPSFLR